VLLGAVSLGGWVQSVRDESKSAGLQSKLDEANGKIESMVGMLSDANKRERAVATKLEFLDRFLSYRNAASDTAAKTTFIGFVCALWRDSQERKVHFDERPLELSPSQFRSGLSPELKKFLSSKGIPEIFFQNAQNNTVPQTSPIISKPVVGPSSGEAIDAIQKVVASEHLVKIVSFYDGTSYRVPDEIAFAVHTDPQCRPR
jgi:hypothetical protein